MIHIVLTNIFLSFKMIMELKTINFDTVLKEWNLLKQLSLTELNNLNGRSRLGCNIIDYYFFEHRLNTKGNKGINFYEFIDNISVYKSKPYIQTLLSYCEKNNRYKDSEVKRYYYIYGLTFGRVNSFKITNALKIYYKFLPTHILDPFCGFGGRMVAALMRNIKYTGIDINIDLKKDYERLLVDFNTPTINVDINILFKDCNDVDYSILNYDMVFTSPPYENIEVYPNNPIKNNKEWDLFYREIFRKLWDNLKHGIFAINIHDKIYKLLIELFGECNEQILLSKSSRNDYKEYIYIWVKV